MAFYDFNLQPDETASEVLGAQGCRLAAERHPGLFDLFDVFVPQGLGHGAFVREELIERTDTGIRTFGDRAHRRPLVSHVGDYGGCGAQEAGDPALASVLLRYPTRSGGGM